MRGQLGVAGLVLAAAVACGTAGPSGGSQAGGTGGIAGAAGIATSAGAGQSGEAGTAGGGGTSTIGGAGGAGQSTVGSGGTVSAAVLGPFPQEACRRIPAAETGFPTALEDFKTAWVATLCANVGPCCTEGTFSEQMCQDHYRGLLDSVLKSDAHLYSYDPAGQVTCLSDLMTDLTTCKSVLGVSCTRVVGGVLRDGEPCSYSVECSSGACVDQGNGYRCGSRDGVGVPEGAPCGINCNRDNYGAVSCYWDPFKASEDDPACYGNEGLFCNAQGVCEKMRSTGGACVIGLTTDPTGCDPDNTCVDNTCVELGEAGDACPCKQDYYCDGTLCQRRLALGQPCEGISPPTFTERHQCEADLTCVEETCQCGGYHGSYALPLVCIYQ